MHSNKFLFSNVMKSHSVGVLRAFSNLTKQKWDVLCAVSLERNPIITKELTELESKMDKMMKDIEYENSYKSNFEIRMQDDLKRQKLLKSGKFDINELDKGGQQTAHDFADSCSAELKSFKFVPRDDPKEEKNLKSTKRFLDRHLLLVIKDKLGPTPLWILPQGIRKEDETLRQTAERILAEKCGSDIKARFFGNAPNGFYKYKYPKSVQKDSIGAKIFFFKAQYLGGSIDTNKSTANDYQWATRNELKVLPVDYYKSVRMFLIDEH